MNNMHPSKVTTLEDVEPIYDARMFDETYFFNKHITTKPDKAGPAPDEPCYGYEMPVALDVAKV